MTLGIENSSQHLQLASRAMSEKQDKPFSGFKFSDNLGSLEDQYQKQENTHIKLMCAMITNQLPDSSFDPNKMNEAIMQGMNTKQMLNISRQMAENNQLQKELSNIEKSTLLGRLVEVPTAEFHFDAQQPANCSYRLPEHCQNPVFAIYNRLDLKNPIFIQELNPQALKGSIAWDGKLENGESVQSGEYVMRVSGQSAYRKDAYNSPIPVSGETSIFLEPELINRDGALVARGMEFSFSDIRSIQNPYKVIALKTEQITQQTQTIDEEV